jgi:anti-sigma regulatory factor (Ser/Thr protein kinase)
MALDFLVASPLDADISPAPRTPHFFSLSNPADLAEILRRPGPYFIEIGERQRIDAVTQRMLDVAPDFALSLDNRTAYRCQVARDVAGALDDRFGLDGTKTIQIRTCLQEALANAILHGNLAMRDNMETRLEFDRYYAEIEARLISKSYAGRRIYCSAWASEPGLILAVCDDGSGFQLPRSHQTHEKLHGRGLFLIQSLADRVWLGDDRRTLYMQFDY